MPKDVGRTRDPPGFPTGFPRDAVPPDRHRCPQADASGDARPKRRPVPPVTPQGTGTDGGGPPRGRLRRWPSTSRPQALTGPIEGSTVGCPSDVDTPLGASRRSPEGTIALAQGARETYVYPYLDTPGRRLARKGPPLLPVTRERRGLGDSLTGGCARRLAPLRAGGGFARRLAP
jgi:hypothetical protein